MAYMRRLGNDIDDNINEMEAIQDRLLRLALAEAVNDTLVPNVATGLSQPQARTFPKPASGDDEAGQASTSGLFVARSLKNTHLPPPIDWEPESDTDSEGENDDEEDFLESSARIKEDEDRLALEYLRGVLEAAHNQGAPFHEDAGHKANDEKRVRPEDNRLDEDDDFVFVDGEDDDNHSSARQSTWQLLHEDVYDEDKKALKVAELDNWRRQVAEACGELFRLHSMK